MKYRGTVKMAYPVRENDKTCTLSELEIGFRSIKWDSVKKNRVIPIWTNMEQAENWDCWSGWAPGMDGWEGCGGPTATADRGALAGMQGCGGQTDMCLLLLIWLSLRVNSVGILNTIYSSSSKFQNQCRIIKEVSDENENDRIFEK